MPSYYQSFKLLATPVWLYALYLSHEQIIAVICVKIFFEFGGVDAVGWNKVFGNTCIGQ